MDGILKSLRNESSVGGSGLLILGLDCMNFWLVNTFCFVDILLAIGTRGFVLCFIVMIWFMSIILLFYTVITYITLSDIRTLLKKNIYLLLEILRRRLQPSQAAKSVLEVNGNVE